MVLPSLGLDEDSIIDDEAYPRFVALRGMLAKRSALVSYSGGVDSSFLALVAKTYCTRSLAVTANSPTLAPGELDRARELAQRIGISHRTIQHNELDDEDFARNTQERCYYCKRGLLRSLQRIARDEGYQIVVEGTNASDIKGHRPGRRAVVETGAVSPLLKAGLAKDDIRRLSKKLGLPTWDRPSMPCLASRIPYHSPITGQRLDRIGKAEESLRRIGFRTVRVRDHGDVARIEVAPEAIPDLASPRVSGQVVRELRALGYLHVSADLKGYRTGSMNEGAVGLAGSRNRESSSRSQQS